MANLPRMEGAEDLKAHQEFLRDMGRIVSGQKALEEDNHGIHVFQLPDFTAMKRMDRMKEMDYGTIVLEDGVVNLEDGRAVYSVGGPQDKIKVLASIRQSVANKKRELSIEANKEHNGEYIRPGGQKGHLLEMYNDLLDQIDHVHHRLRDEIEES